MTKAHSLIAAFNELKQSEDRTVSQFSPSLIGLFGSISIFDAFLMEVDAAITAGQVPPSLKKRSANLIDSFIPQVAEYNDIKNPSSLAVNADDLKNVTAGSLEQRRKGVEIILSALIMILKEVDGIPLRAA